VVDDFDVDWLTSGPRQGMARGFNAHLTYRESPESAEQPYDLKVNHPLKIGGTELFLIGHGYAPVITIRDGNGDLAYSGPTIFLPESSNFLSFGVVRAPDAQPTEIGLEGLFYPTYLKVGDDPINVMGDLKNPTLSLQAYTGDLGMDEGSGQSVYVLDKAKATLMTKPDGSMFRVDLQEGQTVKLPGGAGTVSFDGVQRWNRIQISRTPGMHVALAGVVLSLVGLLASLFIRPRRVWVRARRRPDNDGADDGEHTEVEVAGLDRSTAGDVEAEVAAVVGDLRGLPKDEEKP
jgi:cytochrome c biogenesis protein